MLALQRLLNALCLFLCVVAADAFSLSHPVPSDLNIYKYHLIQYPMDYLSNDSKGFVGSKTLLLAQKEGSPRGNKQDMTPEQRERFKERRKRFESLSPQEKKRVKEARKKFKQLPPEEREKLRKKWRDLSPKERDRAIKKKRKKNSGV